MDSLNQWLLVIILFWPLVSAVLALITSNERLIKWGSIVASLLPLGLSIVLLFGYDWQTGQMAEQWTVRYEWIPALNASFHLGVDGLSIPLIFLTTLLSTLSLYYSAFVIRYRVKEYFVMFHLLQLSMLGVFMALDYVLFYVFWEISLVPMYLLIGIWGGKNRQYASIKFFIYTLVGSVFMLLAVLGTYSATGTFDILEAAAAKPFQGLPGSNTLLFTSLAFWGFFLGFAFKVPAFPFHTWLPDAHTEAPTAGSVILAGVLLKLGAYGFLRIVLPTYPTASVYWSMWLVAIGVIAIVYGAFVCVAQTDLKRLIAYSSVSHMGYVMLGIGAAATVLTPEGAQLTMDRFGYSAQQIADHAAMAINGATLQMFNHGIITGALFLLVGVLYERAHTRELAAFGGLGTRTPYFYGIALVALFASLGLPESHMLGAAAGVILAIWYRHEGPQKPQPFYEREEDEEAGAEDENHGQAEAGAEDENPGQAEGGTGDENPGRKEAVADDEIPGRAESGADDENPGSDGDGAEENEAGSAERAN